MQIEKDLVDQPPPPKKFHDLKLHSQVSVNVIVKGQ